MLISGSEIAINHAFRAVGGQVKDHTEGTGIVGIIDLLDRLRILDFINGMLISSVSNAIGTNLEILRIIESL